MPMEPASSWKQATQSPPTAKPIVPWRKGAAAAQPPGKLTGRLALGIVWFSFLALCTALVWIATWISPPRDVALYVLGADYYGNLVFPPDCAGQSLQRELAGLTRKKLVKPGQPATLLRLVQDRVHELRTDAAWDVGLDTFSESTLLMVVTGHGGADILGPYVIPTNADARPEPRHRLRVDTILDRLDTLPTSVKIVLIFDVTQMPSHWPLGMLHNDFAHGVQMLNERIMKRANLVVIVSSGPDQLSWTTHSWGKTVFGHFLLEGLRGGADRDDKQKIDAWELYQFTKENVTRWTRVNRAAEQTPMILPNEAETRARPIILNVGDPSYMPMNPEQRPKFALPDAWSSAWQEWQRLRATAPQVAAPYLWRQYQECLLHHETALRFGDTAVGEKKRAQLSVLASAIAKAQEVRLRSIDATLTMNTLTGIPHVKDEALETFLKKFWTAGDEEDARNVWNDGKKTLWNDSPVPVRALAEGIVERMRREKFAGLERAGHRLRMIRQPEVLLPAEAHWLVMMDRDLIPLWTKRSESGLNTRGDSITNAPAEVTDLFALALDVRTLAEHAAVSDPWPRDSELAGGKTRIAPAYSIEIQPWIGPSLTEADEKRRFGQDLLLSSRPKDWQESRMLLLKARAKYQEIQHHAAILRDALDIRDRALVELPAYAHWLAQRPDLGKRPVQDPSLDEPVKNLWRDTHALLATLQTPNAASIDACKSLAESIEQRLNDLGRRFDLFVGSLLDASGDERHVWLEAEAALVVLRPNLERRKELVIRQHILSRRIEFLAQAEELPGPTVSATESAKRRAKREGELALAFLGTTWVNRFSDGKDETALQIQRRLEDAIAEESVWHKTITRAGRQIGLRYRVMAGEIERLLAVNPRADLAKHRGDVGAADLLARRMEATLNMPDGLDPAGDYRRFQLGMFLAAQTKRTLDDHWYDDNPTTEPYYRLTGRVFLSDAQAQMPAGKRDRWKDLFTQVLGDLSKKLEAPGDWTLVETTLRTTDVAGRLIPDPGKVGVVTSEQQIKREFRLWPASKDDRPPAGFPVLWPEDSPDLRAINPPALERGAVSIPASPAAGQAAGKSEHVDLEQAPTFTFQLASPLVDEAELKGFPSPFVQRAPFKVRGLFRGQQIKLESPVDLHPQATTILKQFPVPAKASVAVRTDKDVTTRVGTNDSGIAFILDCSGSMRAIADADTKQNRYQQALDALRLVLQRVPKDTSISVLTFGQAIGMDKTAKAEQTIEHALKPTLWNPQDPKQLDELMTRLQALEPWNESPISRTLLFAREDLVRVKGAKTIIVISDGHDNRFDEDAELTARYKNVPALLKSVFDNGAVSLHLIVFPTNDADEKKSIGTYKIIESFNPAGKVHSIRDAAKLPLILDVILRQRLNYWIDRTGRNVTVNEVPETGLDVSTSDRNDRWFSKGLPVGGHKVRVQVPERVEKDILLHRGDLLLLDLVSTPKGLGFERYLFSDDYPWKRRIEDKAKDWRLSVLQNQQTSSGGLEILLALEKTVDRRETVLEQIKPRETWIELKVPPEVETGTSVRIGAMVGYPAPAWSLDVPAWPNFGKTTTAARPVIDLWWNPDEAARAGAELPLHLLLDERQRPVVMKGEKNVIIESVNWERHRVEVERGVFDTRDCLVVRLRHDNARPILTRIGGLELAGAEHRFYANANKVAALYWFADKNAKAQLDEARLRLISVSAFKDEATQRGNWLQIRDLSSPEPTDFRPRPPIELK